MRISDWSSDVCSSDLPRRRRRTPMRVMVFVKATEDSERGLPPAAEMTELFEAMGKFNEELVNAGVMIDGDGLKPSSAGKRDRKSGVEGKSVSVRVDRGGRRILKKKKRK